MDKKERTNSFDCLFPLTAPLLLASYPPLILYKTRIPVGKEMGEEGRKEGREGSLRVYDMYDVLDGGRELGF